MPLVLRRQKRDCLQQEQVFQRLAAFLFATQSFELRNEFVFIHVGQRLCQPIWGSLEFGRIRRLNSFTRCGTMPPSLRSPRSIRPEETSRFAPATLQDLRNLHRRGANTRHLRYPNLMSRAPAAECLRVEPTDSSVWLHPDVGSREACAFDRDIQIHGQC